MNVPDPAQFRAAYAAALRRHLAEGGQESLAVGHELGRRALAEGVSILDITEGHFRAQGNDDAAGLGFLLQTLAALDVATRGFLDGNRRFQQARETALALQRAMLGPIDLPPAFAVRYEPAVQPLEIGGDWYDVVGLPGGRWGLIVGDCVGRGLTAAAVMGQIRSAARALMLHGAGPGAVLDGLDLVAERIDGALCTTVCAAIVDPARGTLHYSSAGHMPGILGETQLWGGRSVPLASGAATPRPEATQELPPGSTLLLFTDGLVEHPGTDLDAAFTRLARLLAAAAGPPPEVADTILGALTPPGGYDDDVAMLVYRQPPAPLLLELPAVPESLARVRAGLRAWLVSAAVPAGLSADVISAVNEACTNSIEHGYRDSSGLLTVQAATGLTELVVTVSDAGTWKPPTHPGDRGRGLVMMRALAAGVELAGSTTGTTAVLRFILPTAAFPARRSG